MTTETSIDAIRKTTTVPLPVEKAFHLFTSGASEWWPFETHSIAGDAVEEAVFDPEAGRVYERAADGTEHDWATITAWEPPNRFVLDWTVNPKAPATEVEVRFVAEGGGTRVELDHHGWEQREAHDRAGYDTGWDTVLARFVERAR